MRISGIAYVNSKGELQIHKNVIEGQTIFDGSILFGIYYPRSRDDPKDVNKSDFMISPIPFDHWKSSSRIILRLKEQTNSIPILTSFLKERNISILQGVSNRSAHRYSTWDIHISFDELSKDALTFIREKSYYKETKIATEELAGILVEKFGEEGEDILFSDPDDIDLVYPVIQRVNTALHYFHDITIQRDKEVSGVDEDTLYSPFSLRYISGVIVSNSGRKLGSILNLSKNNGNTNRSIPTIAFIESDSHYLHFRVRVMPREKLDDFYKLSVFYERIGQNHSTTRGLLDTIMNEFPDVLKVWMSYNQLYECRSNYGCGRINFFIESKGSKSKSGVFMDKMKGIINTLNNDHKPNDLKHVNFWPKISPIYPDYVQKHFKGQRKWLKQRKRDVFISYSNKDNKQAEKIRKVLEGNGITVFKADVELNAGDTFNEKIRDGLNKCREVCLLYSPRSASSEYIITEWGAAWFMKKTIVTMFFDMDEEQVTNKKDKRLSNSQIMRFEESSLQDYANKVLQRRLEHFLETDDHEYYN